MFKLGIVQRGNAFYPETNAYIKYLEDKFVGARVAIYNDFKAADSESDIVIYYGGFLPFWTKRSAVLFLEYHSLSTGKFPRIKNLIKRFFSVKPDYYIFLNEFVSRELFFRKKSDKYIYRSMGYNDLYLGSSSNVEKVYDFIYMGSLNRNGVVNAIMEVSRRGYTIAVVGCTEKEINYFSSNNIKCFGRLPQDSVFDIAVKAEYGLNYTDEIYPYIHQDSTKLIEYCALGLKVVTNKYPWVNDFERKISASFLDYKDFLMDHKSLESFNFLTGNIEELSWNKVIDRSGLAKKIREVLSYENSNI